MLIKVRLQRLLARPSLRLQRDTMPLAEVCGGVIYHVDSTDTDSKPGILMGQDYARLLHDLPVCREIFQLQRGGQPL